MADSLNADFTRAVALDTSGLAWQPSPVEGVWRKRLYAEGDDPEQARVTSLVRFDAGARFPFHEHPGGEEVFVIEGDWRDEHGSYAAGTWLLSPETPGHAPWSETGCLLLVRLRQYPGAARIVADTGAGRWQAGPEPGIACMSLLDQAQMPERIQLERWEAGARSPAHGHPRTVELYILDGTFEDEHGAYPAGTWLRVPVGSRHAPFSSRGCRLLTHVGGGPAG